MSRTVTSHYVMKFPPLLDFVADQGTKMMSLGLQKDAFVSFILKMATSEGIVPLPKNGKQKDVESVIWENDFMFSMILTEREEKDFDEGSSFKLPERSKLRNLDSFLNDMIYYRVNMINLDPHFKGFSD